MGSTDHIVIVVDTEGYTKSNPHIKVADWCQLKTGCLLCEKCGETFNYDRPVRIDMAAGVAQVFKNLHENCGKDEDGGD